MRIAFLALMIAGFGTAFIYPWYMNNFTGSEIGRWTVAQERGIQPAIVEADLTAQDAPVRIFVDATTLADTIPTDGVSKLSIAVMRDGQFPVLSEVLTFTDIGNSKQQNSPKPPQIMRQSAGEINPVADDKYAFRILRGDRDGLQIAKIELILRKSAETANENIVSFGLLGGVMGLYLFIRTRRRKVDK